VWFLWLCFPRFPVSWAEVKAARKKIEFIDIPGKFKSLAAEAYSKGDQQPARFGRKQRYLVITCDVGFLGRLFYWVQTKKTISRKKRGRDYVL